MPKLTNARTRQRVDLTQDDFKFQGGEGAVYFQGGIVYKVCDPGKMIPVEKIKELAILDHPQIVRPEDVLLDGKKVPVGYTMRMVPNNPRPLAQILSKVYREREGVTPQHMLKLVQQKRDLTQFYHDRQCLRVDANEFNDLVTGDYSELYFIDVNSDQTPHFPATAIMPNIEDYQCNGHWSELSDWYSFCIISFYMFTGIHPFKGWHPCAPSLKTAMIDCMKAGKSVLDPETKFPQGAVYFPFENFIPGGNNGGYMNWYRAILIDGKRLPPPKSFQDTLGPVLVVRAIAGTNNFEIYELHNYHHPIVAFYHRNGKEVVVTKEALFLDNLNYPLPAKRFRVAFSHKFNIPVAVSIENKQLKLFDLDSRTDLPTDVAADDLMSYGGRVYIKCGRELCEVSFLEQGGNIVGSGIRRVAMVAEHATELYQGVAVQQLFGTYFVDVFPDVLDHKQIKIPELDGYKIVDAKCEANVLMVVGATRDGHYDRLVFRFSEDWNTYDLRKVENVPHVDINFTVLPKGIVLCLTEMEKLEIFPATRGSTAINEIADPVLKGDMRLCHTQGALIAQGNRFYSFAMRK